MTDKPTTAEGYQGEHLALVRATCLYVATKLGDLMDDLVVVGGLVPSLIVDQAELPEGAETHIGTMDLDVGLTMALLEEERYREVAERLRRAGFTNDVNEDGNPTRQRWTIEEGGNEAKLDFLIQPSLDSDRGGKLRNLEQDFAAIIAPAFRDRRRVELAGRTIKGEEATRTAAARTYVIRNYGAGPKDVAARLRPLLKDADAQKAVEVLRRDYAEHNHLGPRRVAEFLTGGADDDIQADVVGDVAALLAALEKNE